MARHLDSRESKHLRDALAALQREGAELPTVQDVEALLPPVRRCYARQVQSTDWWVFWELGSQDISILAVARRDDS